MEEGDDIEKDKLTADIVNEPRVSKYILGFYLALLTIIVVGVLYYEGITLETALVLGFVVLPIWIQENQTVRDLNRVILSIYHDNF